MSRIVVLCATVRDRRELARLRRDGDVFAFHEYGTAALESLVSDQPDLRAIACPEAEIERIVESCGAFRPDGIVSTDDYPGSILASIVADRLGLPGVPPATSLLCQHKYHSRCAQRAAVPDATPAFELVDWHSLPAECVFPVFVKPVKSFFSVGARRVDTPAAFPAALRKALLPRSFFDPFERLLRRHSTLAMRGHALVESLLAGRQCTVEGYVSGGTIRILGIVDSLMYPGTASFLRFDYPSRLPAEIQSRIRDIASRFVSTLDYGDGLFNIEMMYDAEADTIRIIEINPRMSSQFADLFEKVDGVNTYSILLDLATGRRSSAARQPGRHRRASSMALRSFENLRTHCVPGAADVAAVQAAYPDIRVEVLTRPGRTLGQELQDGHSYRYALINAGGSDDADLDACLRDCIAHLPFRFARVEHRTGVGAKTAPAALRAIRSMADRYRVPGAGAPLLQR